MNDLDKQEPQWLQAVNAVTRLGRPASVDDVWAELKKVRSDIPRTTVGPDLNSVAVNAPSRTSYLAGKEPRRTDSANRYDRLLKLDEGRDARFVPYDPSVHGVWEIYADPNATSTYKTSIRKVGENGHAMTAPSVAGTGEKSHSPRTKVPSMLPVNKILYGPPGTGKTYHTVNEALRILDPAFLAANEADRVILKRRFDALAQAGLIRFVTFHQSFSYEDFVEGIRASTDETTGALRYEVEDGVFKLLCEAARSRNVAQTGSGIEIAERRIWKISLGDANTEGHIFEECMAKGIALLGFGSGADLTGVSSRAEIVDRLRGAGEQVNSTDYAVSALDLFVRRVQSGDLVVVSQGNLKFRAIGEVTGDYVHFGRDGADNFAQGRPVRWLRQYYPARPYVDLMENRFSQMTIYELRPGSINLERLAALLAPNQTEAHEPEARVLIIDEINRGNVSRVFGELITLIEPSKREGCAEALEVTLPYSKERFSVPSNVHLIGTMNTADRSLAGLDVALRRRFEFVEMLPDAKALAGVVVADVPVDELLSTMNQRIEVLLGRDYTLGHAYFIGLTKSSPIEFLADVFRRQVLPLLQEYFFEDWQKIAWVLNDHRKSADLQFLQQVKTDMTELLGDDVELPREGRLWTINPDAFTNPQAYLAIIKAPQGVA
ncbi:MAG: AAA family ATPase [Paracoccaceae bacterium]